jgi:hypothetical protein
MYSGLYFLSGIAEVVGSNPTRSIIINQGNYDIKSGLLWEVVGQTTNRHLSLASREYDLKAIYANLTEHTVQ